MNHAASPVPQAATVILLRPSNNGSEVLLMQRHHNSGFMGGASVFPGGRVEPSDHHVVAPTAFHAAAVRETLEEVGIVLRPADLEPHAWWLTPVQEKKRFDTRFFVARVSADTEPTIDAHEAIAARWLTPNDALRGYEDGSIILAPPTLCTLEDLAWGFVPPADVCICPELVVQGDDVILALPGDALHPNKARVFSHRTRLWRSGSALPLGAPAGNSPKGPPEGKNSRFRSA